MEGRNDCTALAQLIVGLPSVACLLDNHLEPSGLQVLQGLERHPHQARASCANDEGPGLLCDNGPQILGDKKMPLPAPPVSLDAIGVDDNIGRVALPINDDVSEAIRLYHPQFTLDATNQFRCWYSSICTFS